ncbi:hypothetical protein GCM10020000_81490 [Streptomyces olivoverticillatus]
MRINQALAAAAVLLSLSSVTACEDTGHKSPGGTGGSTGPAQQAGPAPQTGPPSARSLDEARKYVSQYASCENLGTDAEDKRLRSGTVKGVGEPVTEAGACSDRSGHGAIGLYLTPDMKKFQAAYQQRVMDRIAAGKPTYGLYSRVFVGKDFVAEPSATATAKALAKSGMRILTCNPTFGVPQGYKKEKALVDSCVLSDFVNSSDGEGSENHEGDQQTAAPSLGLPSAGSLAELRKLVASSVNCTHFATDPETVSIQSIDYQPVIDGDKAGWGVGERGLCGETAGAQRAHGLAWLDKVDDMLALQTRAKAAQLGDLKANGDRVMATKSMLLVGQNIAVETNDVASRHGLYQQQFLALNCRPGFTAPQGYRYEKAMVDGCVLTNYEGEGGPS